MPSSGAVTCRTLCGLDYIQRRTCAHEAPHAVPHAKIFIGSWVSCSAGFGRNGRSLRPLSILFLNLIKSIIAPLIFATLVIGIAGTGDIRQVGRIGFKALLYFEIVTTFALFIGLGAVNLTKPGVGVSLAGVHTDGRTRPFSRTGQRSCRQKSNPRPRQRGRLSATAAAKAAAGRRRASAKGLTAPDPPAKPQKFGDIIAHLAPASIIKAMAEGDVLQIVVFSRALRAGRDEHRRKSAAGRQLVRVAGRHHVPLHRVRHEVRADRRRRGHGQHRRPLRPRRPEEPRHARADALRRAGRLPALRAAAGGAARSASRCATSSAP